MRLEREGSDDDTDNAWLEVEAYHVELGYGPHAIAMCMDFYLAVTLPTTTCKDIVGFA